MIDKAAKSRESHQIRRRPTGFGFVFADRIGYLDPVRWDEMTRSAAVFIKRPYLSALEQFGPANITPRYAMIFRGDEAVAALALQVVNIDGRSLTRSSERSASRSKLTPKTAFKSASKKIGSKAVNSINAKVLVCGNLMSWGQHGVAIAEGESPADVWPAVAEAIYRIRRAEKLSNSVALVMIKDFSAEDAPHTDALGTYSYRAFETDPDMVLDLKPAWTGYDGYLADLASKYRKNVVKMHKSVEEAGWSVEALRDVAPSADALFKLYMQVHDHAAVRLFTLKPEFIPTLAHSLGDDFRCTVIRRNGTLAGFVTTLKDRDTAYGYYLGYDRAANESAPIYFRLLHAVIADAISLGCRRVSLGRTALEPKAKLGARPVPLSVHVRHRHPLLNKLMRPLLSFVPHDEAPDRNPFKSEKPADPTEID